MGKISLPFSPCPGTPIGVPYGPRDFTKSSFGDRVQDTVHAELNGHVPYLSFVFCPGERFSPSSRWCICAVTAFETKKPERPIYRSKDYSGGYLPSGGGLYICISLNVLDLASMITYWSP